MITVITQFCFLHMLENQLHILSNINLNFSTVIINYGFSNTRKQLQLLFSRKFTTFNVRKYATIIFTHFTLHLLVTKFTYTDIYCKDEKLDILCSYLICSFTYIRIPRT